MEITDEVRSSIISSGLIKSGDYCIAAVSGGADSTGLMILLSDISREMDFTLSVLHIHHGLRGAEADADAAFVKNRAEELGLECSIRYVKAGEYAETMHMSTEEAARLLRYEEFEREAAGIEAGTGGRCVVAVAHNRDDNAETVIMQLCRGSGLRGCSGMRVKRDRIIRPLLNVSRDEIESFLNKRGEKYRTDSSNLSDEYTRNRIRHNILPLLKSGVSSAAVENINRAGALIGEADEYIRAEANRFAGEAFKEVPGGGGLRLELIMKRPHIIQCYMIYELIRSVNGHMKDIGSAHIEAVLGLMDMQPGKSVFLPYSMRAYRDYESLSIIRRDTRDEQGNEREEAAEIHEKSFEIRRLAYKEGMEIPQDKYVKWFDAGKLNSEPLIRTRRTGDYIELKDGKHKSIKAFMSDAKIPARDRDRIPLVTDMSHVLWIVGYRISEYYKVGKGTGEVMEIRVLEGDNI